MTIEQRPPLTAFDKAILALLPHASQRGKSGQPRCIAFVAADHYAVLRANKGQRAAVSRSLYKMLAMRLVGRDLDSSNIARGEWWQW
jgi:hypothetical protein